jgi:hypothetical protein
MRPVCGAPLLMGLIVCVVLSGQAGAQAKKPELERLPPEAYRVVPPVPAISCDVSAASVSPGQSVEVMTRIIQGDAGGLKYSFETSAGRLTVAGVNASTARLDTAGVTAGEISVTCVVVDAYGRKVSYGKVIRLGNGNAMRGLSPAQRFPASVGSKAPPIPKHAEVPEMAHVAQPPAPPPAPVLAPKSGAPPSHAAQPVGETGGAPVARPPNQVGGGAAVGAVLGGILGGGKGAAIGAAAGNGSGAGNGAGSGSGSGRHSVTHGSPVAEAPAKTPAADTGSNEYAEGLAIQKWKKDLRTGKIDYNLPTKMSLPDATTVSVVVHGYEDVNGAVQAGVKSAALKVSQRMRVTLGAEGNPDEFKIEPDGSEDVQLVPIDGTATWQWKVTPKEPAADQKLTIRALLVYPDDPNKADVEITSYTAEVSVQVGSLWEWVKYLFWNDPMGLVKYLLPGGAGFAFVAGLVVWWWKRKHPEKKD